MYDVIIIGGGLAGCATALSIAKHHPHLKYLVVNDSISGVFKIGESLPPEASLLLQYIHPSLPSLPPKAGLTCTGRASAWASNFLEEHHSIMNPFGSGWHLDRSKFDEAIRSFLNEHIIHAKFVDVKRESGYFHVHINSVNQDQLMTLQARYVVDASGRKASAATKLGARVVNRIPLLAFYTIFTTEEVDMDHRTIVEAVPQGWFYTSLVPHNGAKQRVVAFHTDPSHPAAKEARRITGFLDLLSATEHISEILNRCDYHPDHSIQCTAAGSSHLEPYCEMDEKRQFGWVAVGDAALAVDPLSSQGMMSALESGYYIGRLIGSDFDHLTVTKYFERVKVEYAGKRDYYYSLLADGRRFGEEGRTFWQG